MKHRLLPIVAVAGLFASLLLGACDTRRESPAPAASASARPAGATPEGVDLDATLGFLDEGKPLRALVLRDLLGAIKPEVFTALDPYYGRPKTYRALPLDRVLALGFAGRSGALPDHEFVLRARDGYTVPMTGARLLEPGAYIAIADEQVPGWEPIGPQRANPGPLYFVWREEHQQHLDTYPRIWQLASIEIARFEDTFPRTVPRGEAEGSPAMRGFHVFARTCIHCHCMNQQGGRVGPDLNVPQSIVEYRPEAQIRAYIRDPRAFRYSNMPAHPDLPEADLDALLAYFRVMRGQKQDPALADGGAP